MAVVLPIITEFDGTGINKAVKQFKQLETTSEKAQFAIKKAAIPAAAALTAVVGVIGSSVKAAIEDQAAQASLARQIKASTGATDDQIKSVEKYISGLGRSAAISDDEARPALQKLIVATKDVAEATKLMNLATDVAAATGKPLVDVTDALAKAYAGNMKGLNALSPEIKAMIKDGASLAEVQKVLEANFGGAGKAAADTAAGGMKKLAIAFAETKEGIGEAFLPVMEKVLPVVQKFSEWAQANPDLLAAVTVSVGALAVSTLALNAAMAVNPFVAMAAGIIAIALAMQKLADAAEKIKGIGGIAAKIIGSIALPGFAGQVLENTIGRFTGKDAPSVDTPSTGIGNIGRAGSAERGFNITVNAGVGDPVAIGKSVVDALNAYKARTGSFGLVGS
jgi:hypothetical protein